MTNKPKCKYCYDKKFFSVCRDFGRKGEKPIIEKIDCPKCTGEKISPNITPQITGNLSNAEIPGECPVCGIKAFAHRHDPGTLPKDFIRLMTKLNPSTL